jgi:glycosyltransferase involved in cell wall biosynthesis
MPDQSIRIGGPPRVSVGIITKNEAASLPDCLRSVARLDDVWVVDSGSSDGTQDIARAHGANVMEFRWNGKYPKKKQWTLDEVPFKYAWVLMLDADERVTPQLLSELSATIESDPTQGAFDVELDYVFLGRTLRYGHRVRKRILLHRERTRFPDVADLDVANMWEVEGHYQPVVIGETGLLSARLRHEDRDTLFDWFSRHNRYSDWEAALAVSGEAARIRGQRSQLGSLFARLPLKPLTFFVYSFAVRRGFRDGYPGFAYSLLQAQYYWHINLKVRELRRLSSEGSLG